VVVVVLVELLAQAVLVAVEMVELLLAQMVQLTLAVVLVEEIHQIKELVVQA
jgi:hypothetical protein